MSVAAIRRLVGERVLSWLALGAAAGAALGMVELAIATCLLLFLESLGLTPFGAARPAWVPAPIPLSRALAGLLVIAAVRAVAHFVASQSSYEAQYGLDARLRRFALHQILVREARHVEAAELHRQLADTFPRAASAANQAAAFTSASVQALVIAVLLLIASPVEALVGLAGLVLVGSLVLGLQRRVRQIAESIPRDQRTLYRGIERVARNFVLVRVLGTERHERGRLTRAVDGFEGEARRASRLVSLAYAATPFFGSLLLVAILALGHAGFHTDATRLVSFAYLYVRFVQTLAGAVRTFTGVAQSWPQLREAAALASGLDEAARAEALGPVAAEGPSPEQRATPTRPPSVALDGVRFRHPGATADVISGLSLDIGSGEQLAIRGPSGAGKSTLVLLVLGFLEPRAGTVRLDGRAPSELWGAGRARIGYVGAEPYLVAGTLRDNLGYGRRTPPTDEAMWSVLATVRLDAMVRARPELLDLPIDENGGGLSAGEQQRVALARALLGDPLLLVLDEVSANLDAELEREIVEVVRGLRGRCTTIVVSHRPAMLAHADRVVTLV